MGGKKKKKTVWRSTTKARRIAPLIAKGEGLSASDPPFGMRELSPKGSAKRQVVIRPVASLSIAAADTRLRT